MCGIFGMDSNRATSPDEDAFIKQAAIAGCVRGLDGIGLVFGHTNCTTSFRKTSQNGATFVNTMFDPSMDMPLTVCSVIGHNRAATVGTISDDTAHPFSENNIIGVHNGTLRGNWTAALEVSKNCDVDSRGVFRAIAHRGIDWTIKRLDGAAALVWRDVPKDTTYVYRNSERPLHYVQGIGVCYYASEAGMLDWLISKNELMWQYEVKTFKAGFLYQIVNGEITELRELQGVAKPVYNYSPKSQGLSTLGQTEGSSGARSGNNGYPYSSSFLDMVDYEEEDLESYGTTSSSYGVEFRAYSVTQAEKDKGIIGEFVELSEEHQYYCDCCNKAITDDSFLEEATTGLFQIHTACLDQFCKEHGTPLTFFLIKRAEHQAA